jgi:Glycosyl hydrolases family 43
MKFLLSAVAALAFCLPAFSAETIHPGELWPDNRGRHIQAHGSGILKFGDTFYWFGEDRSPDLDWRSGHVSCYASTNLVDWKFCRDVLNLTAPENFGRQLVLERPKVFYNAPTKKFVMYFHMDDGRYRAASVGVAVSDTVDGTYKFLKYFRPLGFESRDIGQFIDDDGAAYLISEDRPNGFHIFKLADDYLSIAKDVCLISEHLEGGALVHYDGLYYVVCSHLTGWSPNPNVYATAKSLAGPWSEFKDLAPPEKNTYGAQSTMLLKITGTKMTTVIFMGDRWNASDLGNSRYLWMPLEIGGGKLKLPEPQKWTLDVNTGEAKLK